MNRNLRVQQDRVVYGVFKGMGDLLAAAPVVKSELEQGRSVTLLIYPQLQSFITLLDFGPASNQLVVCTLPAGKGPRQLWQLFSTLSKLSPTLVLISPHAPSPAASWKVPLVLWLARLLYWRGAVIAGASAEPFSALFSQRFPIDRELPLAAREWSLYRHVRAGGSRTPPAVRFKSSMYPKPGLHREFDLMIHPGATAENRKWPLRHYAELMRLLPPGFRVAIVGLPSDLEPLRKITGNASVEFISGTLEEAIVSLGRARVVMTMDSGSMFFANMLGIPTVALFGPSAPQFVIPQPSNILPVYNKSLPCQPCRSATCSIVSIECMARIEPKLVAMRLADASPAPDDR